MFYSCKLPHFFYFGSYQLVTTLDILKNESPWTLCLLSILQLKDTKDEVLYTTLWSTFITLKMDDNVGLHTITSSSSLIVLGSYMISFNFFFLKTLLKLHFPRIFKLSVSFHCWSRTNTYLLNWLGLYPNSQWSHMVKWWITNINI